MAMVAEITQVDASKAIDPILLIALASSIDGTVILPVDEQYDEIRNSWSGPDVSKPAVIVQPVSDFDVRTSVRFASMFGLPLSVRGDDFGVTSLATADGGVMIDLSYQSLGVQYAV